MTADLSSIDEPVAAVFKRLDVDIDDMMYSFENFGNYQIHSHKVDLHFRVTRDKGQYFLDWRSNPKATWMQSPVLASNEELIQLIEQIVSEQTSSHDS